jgi:methyltransferase (TIGR00027 family)
MAYAAWQTNQSCVGLPERLGHGPVRNRDRSPGVLETEPSRTALAAAAYRAFHQLLDGGRLFADPLALRILGDDGKLVEDRARSDPATLEAHRGMRLYIAVRSAIAEARLKAAVEARGVRQLVVLGAGQDTFAYRNPFGDALRVFEVDHPATQAWKRRRLAETGIAIPPWLTFAPVNFETDGLLAALEAAGLDPAARTVFIWLGVVPYLTREAIVATLRLIGALPGGGEVVFDYSDPPASLTPEMREAQQERARAVASIGEPFLSNFEPADLHAILAAAGLGEIEDLGPADLMARYFRPGEPATGTVRTRGGHVLWAATSFG